ncbi:MAG: hypothetical protein QOF48_93 [Verrucomicrobiota bacterium]|jgi:hypothetical protein
MLPLTDSDTPLDPETSTPTPDAIRTPNFDTPPRLIAELVGDPNFPNSALGLHVDIGGITGVITEIVKRSVKLRTPEGSLKSYSTFTLCKLHAAAPRPHPTPAPVAEAPPVVSEDDEVDAPEIQVIEEPDFNLPMQPISDWVRRADFPKCAWGAHVDLGGYTGVVVEIVKQSLKVLSPEGDLRSYNAGVLLKLHGGR